VALKPRSKPKRAGRRPTRRLVRMCGGASITRFSCREGHHRPEQSNVRGVTLTKPVAALWLETCIGEVNDTTFYHSCVEEKRQAKDMIALSRHRCTAYWKMQLGVKRMTKDEKTKDP
jgi:hypothetical protein